MTGLLAKERIVAAPGFNRWRVPIASILIHLCIGSVYAWSIYSPHLIRINGVVTSGLYNSTMILMALLLAGALISNALMKPVDSRHHIREEPA